MACPLRAAIDAFAGAILAGAVCFAGGSLAGLPLLFAGSVAAIAFIWVFNTVARPSATAPAAASFVPLPLEFDEEPALLLLDRPFADDPPSSRLVRLFGAMPTPGEMHRTIERHLSAGPGSAPDATEELREALAQLRRAVR